MLSDLLPKAGTRASVFGLDVNTGAKITLRVARLRTGVPQVEHGPFGDVTIEGAGVDEIEFDACEKVLCPEHLKGLRASRCAGKVNEQRSWTKT
jgi:hypothetical protein